MSMAPARRSGGNEQRRAHCPGRTGGRRGRKGGGEERRAEGRKGGT
jgi:hypothetical protein